MTTFGCRKDGQPLDALLKKGEFKGILVSDDAAAYQGFNQTQKCWTDLTREAIKRDAETGSPSITSISGRLVGYLPPRQDDCG